MNTTRTVVTPGLSPVDYDPFAGAGVARAVPTTEAQREIWLATQLSREASLAFNESASLDIRGALELSALQRALQALSARHEMLRATVSGDGMHLLIGDNAGLQAHVLDLRALGDSARAAALAGLRAEAVETAFDLVGGPLFRATLVRLSTEHAELILTGHHIVYDGWSCGVLATELMKLYEGFAAAAPASLAPADSFADYAVAERDSAHLQAAETASRYWRDLYDAALPVLDLPTDRARPAQRSFRSRREDLPLDAALVGAIRQFGARQGASLFATLFAMFGALMARLSGCREVVLGVPAAGQAASGKALLVGHCINLLPIRLATDPAAPIGKLIGDARSQVLDAYEHQSCTFGSILRQLQVARDPSRLPLVQVLFNVDAAIRGEALSGAGLSVELHSNPRHFENFELFLNASQVNGAIVLELQYNTDLFDQATVQRWLALYRAALERVVVQPAQSLSTAFAPLADELALLARINSTAADYPHQTRIETLIARQAAATPAAPAVVAGDVSLSYRELDQRANGVAALLQEQGVGAGDLVGLSCGRNEHMLAGLLGILKAGAGYVPLDPAFPAKRLAFMAADAALRCVLADHSIGGDWQFGAARRIDIDAVAAREAAPEQDGGTADSVAYVIYTSGSTGQPKGVQVPQRAVVNFLASMRHEPGMGPGDRLLAVTTLSFDIAVLELLLPLSAGATVILASGDQARDPQALAQLLAHSKASIMQATPGTWRLLLDAGWRGAPGFKALIGGEALPPDLAARLLPATTELWNMYGPTETTVWSSCWRVGAPAAGISIGRPIANTSIWILDEQRQPCPLGVAGEIWIGGAGVTLGYLNQPQLTAQRFIDDPFSPAPGARLYGTGDRGRWRADGLLEHLGRNDAQVKVRGFRIELGEIEAVLEQHPGVAQSVVIAREDTPGDVRLVAYFVARDAEPASDALRSHLRAMLPEYMLPQHLVALARLPLLPNGKIDRKALPRPEAERGGARLAARTPLERQLLTIMEQVLNLPELGVEDDFFALGGHSLLAARLAAQINRELALRLPLSMVFQAPTVARLARAIGQAGLGQVAHHIPLLPSPQQAQAPATLMQERVRFVEELFPGSVAYSVPSAHRLHGPLEVDKFTEALKSMVQRQSALRTTLVQEPLASGANYIQSVQDSVQVDLPLIELGQIDPARREAELMQAMQREIDTPIALERAPLLRTRLYRLSADEHVFLFITHHLIWDGWSFDLLYREMAEIYAALVEGRAHRLPPLEVSYGDFARWHAEWLKGEAAAQQLGFWKAHYQTLLPGVLPRSDRPRSGHMNGAGNTLWLRVAKDRTEQLRAIAQGWDATLNMLCLSAFGLVLSTALGHRQVALGVPVHGRVESVLEPVMGFFTNLIPVHASIDPQASFGDTVGAVKTLLLSVLSHADLPFERLIQEREVAEHIKKAGLYHALFSFQDARERRREWGPLRHESIPVKQHAATQDIGLWLREGPTGIEGGLMYNADLYDDSTARLLHQAFLIVLDEIAAGPHRYSSELLATADSRLAGSLAPLAVAASAGATTAPAATATATELTLAALWAALLGIDAAHISGNDNFFDLGGSSLLAMRAVADAERSLGRTVDPRRLVFETLRQVALAYDEGAAVQPKKGVLNRLFGALRNKQ